MQTIFRASQGRFNPLEIYTSFRATYHASVIDQSTFTMHSRAHKKKKERNTRINALNYVAQAAARKQLYTKRNETASEQLQLL